MFKDPWLPKESTFKPICIDPDYINSKVADFISPSGGWNVDLLNKAVIHFDRDSIKGVPIFRNLQDKFSWHFDRTGSYTVKSGYKMFMKLKLDGISASSNPMEKVWKILWSLNIPSKIKHFIWKALNNSLPNKMNLIQKGINISPDCPICNFQIEHTDHILFLCSRSTNLWKLTHSNVFLEENFHGSFIDRWLKIVSNSSKEEIGRIATICWSLWNDRNKALHGEHIPSLDIKRRWISEYLSSFQRENSRSQQSISSNQTQQQAQSIPRDCGPFPPDGFWQLNIDASCSSSSSSTGLGILCRDKDGKCVAASSLFLDFQMEALHAELRSILEGMILALNGDARICM